MFLEGVATRVRRSLPNDREFCAVVDLISLGVQALWTKKLLFVVLAAATLITLSGPQNAKALPFGLFLCISIGIGATLTLFGVILGSYVVILGARAGLSVRSSSQLSGVFVSVLLTPIFMNIFSDEAPLSPNYLLQLSIALGVMITVSLGVTFIFSAFVEDEVLAILKRHGLGAGQNTLLQFDPLQSALPAEMRGPVQKISVEGNEIAVTTDKGITALQMSLGGAIEKLNGSTGLRVHRSVWVNETQMARLFYENGNPRLQIKDGTSLPVSRTMVEQIKQKLEITP